MDDANVLQPIPIHIWTRGQTQYNKIGLYLGSSCTSVFALAYSTCLGIGESVKYNSGEAFPDIALLTLATHQEVLFLQPMFSPRRYKHPPCIALQVADLMLFVYFQDPRPNSI